MRGYTHLVVGASLGAIAAHLTGTPAAVGAVVGGFAALVPDVDHPSSLLGRHVPLGRATYRPWPTRRDGWRAAPWGIGGAQCGRRLGPLVLAHRGITHSVGALVLTTWLVYRVTHGVTLMHLYLTGLWVCWAVGYGLGHLALDGLNMAPALFWWPLRWRYTWLLPTGVYQGSTGGKVVELLIAGVALGAAAVVLGL